MMEQDLVSHLETRSMELRKGTRVVSSRMLARSVTHVRVWWGLGGGGATHKNGSGRIGVARGSAVRGGV